MDGRGGARAPGYDVLMPVRLDSRDAGFEAAFRSLLAMKREVDAKVDEAVAAILADVASRGDEALIELTARFDRVRLEPATLRISPDEIARAQSQCDGAAISALRLAAARIQAYHERQRPADMAFRDELGVELGWRWTAIASVGLYVPGGTAAYPSSVLMNAIPAKVAGCERLVMVVTASAERRRSRRSPTALGRSRRWPRSPAPETPMWRRRSGGCSARSAST
jgi:histidinol dehydrogenase